MGVLVVTRGRGSARFRKIKVLVDGTEVARVGHMSTEYVTGLEGEREVWAELDWLRSTPLVIDFGVKPEITVACGWRYSGLRSISGRRADGELWLSLTG